MSDMSLEHGMSLEHDVSPSIEKIMFPPGLEILCGFCDSLLVIFQLWQDKKCHYCSCHSLSS